MGPRFYHVSSPSFQVRPASEFVRPPGYSAPAVELRRSVAEPLAYRYQAHGQISQHAPLREADSHRDLNALTRNYIYWREVCSRRRWSNRSLRRQVGTAHLWCNIGITIVELRRNLPHYASALSGSIST